MRKRLLDVRVWLICLVALATGYSSFGQYCTSSLYASWGGCTYYARVNSFTTSGGVDNITSTSTGCGSTSTGYSDYTDKFVSQYPGSVVNFSASITYYSSAAMKIWVDWNGDEDFSDAGEEVYTSSSTGYLTSGTTTGSFEVPAGATIGDTRMRIRVFDYTYAYSYYDACYSYYYGEAEDYKFTILEAEDCGDVSFESDAVVSGPDSICSGIPFNMTASGYATTSGLTRKWQYAPAGSGTWTDAGSSAIYAISSGISASTDYRYIVTCGETGDSDTSATFTVDLKPGTDCYCTPSYTYGCSYYTRVDDFTTTGGIDNISNLNTGCSSGGYGNYTGMSASQYQGSGVNYSITLGSPYSSDYGGLKMWIDWDQDGTFETDEVIYESTSSIYVGDEVTGSFEVPFTATEGITRLRIRTDAYASTVSSPCSSYYYGEVEDYAFEVLVPDPCSEVPFTDIVLSSVDSICAGEEFTITSTGTPAASGLSKVWESSPTGEGDWTVITGASSSFLTLSDGITESTDFRYTVTCDETGESEVSNIVTVIKKAPTECYCDVSYTYGCGYYTHIDDFSTSDAVVDISNLGTGCGTGYSSPGGYSDYTDMEAEAYQGTIVNYDIGLNDANGGAKMWIDWNQDGDFSDSGELIYTSGTSSYAPMSISGSFEVPYDAVGGPTGVRIRTFAYTYAYDYYDACYSYYYGETEDYTLNVLVPDPCDEVPFTGLTIEGPETICAANTLTITSDGTPIATGLVRIWQSKTASGDWTTITGATSLNLVLEDGITEASDFRYIVTCTLTGESDTSNVISVTLNPPTECYCEAEFSNAYYIGSTTWYPYDIKDVILRGQTDTMYNLSADYSYTDMGEPGGYTDYTSDTPEIRIPDWVQTGTYTGQIKVTYPYGSYITDRVWIDFDDDGIFDDSDEIHAYGTDAYTGFGSSTPDNFSYTVPEDANPGLHRLRIRVVTLYSYPFPIDPCYTYTNGETHDYLVNIVELKPCSEVVFPDKVNALSSPPNVCGSGDITLTLEDAMPLAAGVTYQWKKSSTETGTYTNVGAELPGLYGPALTVEDVSEDTYFKCYVLCEGEPILISEVLLVQAVDLDDVEISMMDGQTCGPGTVALSGTTTDGSLFWYTEAEGGSPIAMGDTFVTPELTVNDTFYATGGAFGATDAVVGDGTSSTYYYTPGLFAPYYGLKTMQYMYTADQLHEAGLMAGDIESVAFDLASTPSVPLLNYTIKIKTVTTAPPMTWQSSGWTTVYSEPSFDPESSGWQTFPFDAPFEWNGTDNIIFEICFQPDAGSSYLWSLSGGTHKYTAKTGQVLYYFPYSATSVCGTYGYTGYNELPNAKFFIPGCETDRVPVVAYVRPVPAPVDIGEDETRCKDLMDGLTLDVGTLPSTYTRLWDDGSTEQTRRITESGTYSIIVANEYGCEVYDTVTKTLLDIPEVELGNDTTVCEGGMVTLDAGTDGTDYYWSTGATTPTIDAITGGMYTVVVANADDCLATDTINVTVSGIMPSVASIIVTNTGLYTFNFEPLLPAHIVGYRWDFGDGSAISTDESPTHTYATSGSYTVTLTVYSDCGEVIYTTTAHIVGVNNVTIDDNSIVLYPNPANDNATVENKGNLKMKALTVTNVLGQVMYQSNSMDAYKHQVDLSAYASGIYTVRIETDKGTVVRKFEIIK